MHFTWPQLLLLSVHFNRSVLLYIQFLNWWRQYQKLNIAKGFHTLLRRKQFPKYKVHLFANFYNIREWNLVWVFSRRYEEGGWEHNPGFHGYWALPIRTVCGLLLRQSNDQLRGVVFNPRVWSFPLSFMGEIVFNAELKSTNDIILQLVKTEWRAVDLASSVELLVRKA